VSNNILRVREELSEEDKNIFKLTNAGLIFEQYYESAVLFGRWYLLKEDPADIPKARSRSSLYVFSLQRVV